MIKENNGHSEKLENWTSKKLSGLSLKPYYFLIILTIAIVLEVFGFFANLH